MKQKMRKQRNAPNLIGWAGLWSIQTQTEELRKNLLKSLPFPTSIPKEIHFTTRFASSLESTEFTEGGTLDEALSTAYYYVDGLSQIFFNVASIGAINA